jgi:hypothetical protein
MNSTHNAYGLRLLSDDAKHCLQVFFNCKVFTSCNCKCVLTLDRDAGEVVWIAWSCHAYS